MIGTSWWQFHIRVKQDFLYSTMNGVALSSCVFSGYILMRMFCPCELKNYTLKITISKLTLIFTMQMENTLYK